MAVPHTKWLWVMGLYTFLRKELANGKIIEITRIDQIIVLKTKRDYRRLTINWLEIRERDNRKSIKRKRE